MIAEIESLIKRRDDARAREAELRSQVEAIDIEIKAAEDKVSVIKSGNTESLTESARQLTEAQSIIEIGTARRQRLLKEASEASRDAESAESTARADIKTAFGFLTRYRLHNRVEALRHSLAEWMSPECIKSNSHILPYLKQTVVSLAGTDRALDRVSQTTGGQAVGQGGISRAAMNGPSVVDDAAYLRVVAAELADAIKWEAKDAEERVKLQRQSPWLPYDPTDRIHLYTK